MRFQSGGSPDGRFVSNFAVVARPPDDCNGANGGRQDEDGLDALAVDISRDGDPTPCIAMITLGD